MSSKSDKHFIGIDGGKNGGLSVLNEKQEIVYCVPMPLVESAKGKTYDLKAIWKIFDSFYPCFVTLEEAQPMFRDGSKQAFTTGELFGMMKALLVHNEIPFEVVRAQTWQKEIFAGITVKDTKGASIEYCQRKFPGYDFTPTERSTKISDGMTDATCLATYGMMRNK